MTKPKRSPPLNSLKVFEAAARHLSFKKAAEELHVTPGAVSHHLSQLEALLGIKLFERLSQGIQLTPSARACLPKLQQGLDSLRESVDLMSRGSRGIISVASSPSFATRWLLPRLHRFVLTQPDIDVHVTTRMGPFVGERSSRGSPKDVRSWAAETDVIILFSDAHFPELQAERLMSLSITPMCSPAFRTRHGLSGDPDELAGVPLLHDDRGALYTQRAFWRRWLDAAGVPAIDADSGLHFAHAILALGAAEEGIGIVASTPVLAADQLKSGRLTRPYDREVPLDASYQVISSELAYRREDVACFRAWLHAEVAHSSEVTREGEND
jgi:LysR family glycine cleavage system transcriptional activator